MSYKAIVLAMLAANMTLQIFVQMQWVARLPGPIEWRFNTLSNHRVHHGRNPRYIDRNLGGVFMFRDDTRPGSLALRLKHLWGPPESERPMINVRPRTSTHSAQADHPLTGATS